MYGDTILVCHFDASLWPPEINRNTWRSLFLWKLFLFLIILEIVILLKIKRRDFFSTSSIPILVSRTVKTWKFKLLYYCTFHKHANSKVQKLPWQLRFSLPSIIVTITSNEPWNTETHKMDRNPPITNQKPWPFEPVKVKFCFLRGPLRWLTAAKSAIVSWLSNFKIRMFVKSAVIKMKHSMGLETCAKIYFLFIFNLV